MPNKLITYPFLLRRDCGLWIYLKLPPDLTEREVLRIEHFLECLIMDNYAAIKGADDAVMDSDERTD
jgi:hypothetical protein